MFWQFRRELTAELCKDNDVYLSVPFGDHVEDLKNLGCTLINTEVSRRGINPVTDYSLYRRYYKLISEIRPDKVITYSIKPNIYAGYVCRKLGIPYYVNVQGLGTAFQKPILKSFVSFMYNKALRDARTVFFENEGNAGYFIDNHIIDEKQVKVLPGAGVNLDFFQQEPYPNNDVLHFLFLGRVMREKGVDELFYSVRKLHEEGKKFHLDIVGFFEDEYKEEVDELVKMGIATFHGFQKDPRPFYKMVDCVVLPSYHEGMSNVLLEAAATGRPLITSDIPGCREAVVNKQTGILVKVKSKDELYMAMKKMLDLTASERSLMGEAGYVHIGELFDKRKVVNETMNNIFM